VLTQLKLFGPMKVIRAMKCSPVGRRSIACAPRIGWTRNAALSVGRLGGGIQEGFGGLWTILPMTCLGALVMCGWFMKGDGC
jgi:hypothetical protein